MSGMFSHCHSLKTLDVDGFDLSSVRDMGYMFEYWYECSYSIF
ncbi:MAG: hypothetical protein GX061_03580 [Eubacteriaceae bacterium]|nr:hypothetical protein [Eubacteriaceae bacterium]